MKFKKRGRSRRPRTFICAAWPIITLAAFLWTYSMGLITETVTNELVEQMQTQASIYGAKYAQTTLSIKNYPGITKDSPGYDEVSRVQAAADPWSVLRLGFESSFPFFYKPSSTMGRSIHNWRLLGLESAVFYQNYSGKDISSGNYLYFPYMSEENWNARSETYEGLAYVDWGLHSFNHEYTDLARFTGYFEGNEFIPIRIELPTGPQYPDPQRRPDLEWETVEADPGGPEVETVTIYTADLQRTEYREGEPITVNGTDYDSLLDLVRQDIYVKAQRISMEEAVAVSYHQYTDGNGDQILVSVGLRGNPLNCAVNRLAPFYACSFLIVAVAVLLILLFLRRNLIKPVEELAQLSTGRLRPLPDEGRSRWHEPLLLQENYATAQQAANDAQNEITRLRTALEYAQNAELHRRQMISNITHELKTPLAVIHSYAEGLRDGIAADKQSQYLNVILEEAQRMDAMVLEMLDLSRLEAGKVRLASDSFSLLKLTRSIFGKLEPLATEKGLIIEYGLTEEFDITADESRIGQVVTNLATNAIKYTPEGGKIHINVFRHGDKTLFSVENQCTPLSEEALNRVWDSFYRTEQSRTSKGTGLGLTIARTIIELHGGTCTAMNTSDGVEFRFILP